jgi:hypothetical protein
MTMRALSVQLLMLVALGVGCGPGTPDAPEPAEPEWAYGWWMDAGGLQDHFEWGAHIAQLEIRSDGTTLHQLDYCDAEDWSYEGRWELQPDGAVRILPADGEEAVPFQYATEAFRYVDLRAGQDSCGMSAVRASIFGGDEFLPIKLERGHWCTGAYLPEFDECEMTKYCGEDPPVCE